jgi:hypothetical protein
MKTKIIISILLITTITYGQFQGDEGKKVDIRQGILSENPMGSIFNFIDPNKFDMNHSFEMSYSTFGGNGMALGVYTNMLSYEFSEKLNMQINTSFVNSPYNTLGEGFTNSINGVYIDNARINYNPSEKFNVSLQFSNSPFNNYNLYNRRGFSPYSNRWFD